MAPIFIGCRNLKTLDASAEKKAEIYKQFNVEELFCSQHEVFTTEVVRDLFSNLSNPVKNKKALLSELIRSNNATALGVLLDMKYVANTKVRDELIDLAVSCGSAECTAILLDYREQTGNRAKEEKAKLKKLENELNMPAEQMRVKAMKAEWNVRLRKNMIKKEYEIGDIKAMTRFWKSRQRLTASLLPVLPSGHFLTMIQRKNRIGLMRSTQLPKLSCPKGLKKSASRLSLPVSR